MAITMAAKKKSSKKLMKCDCVTSTGRHVKIVRSVTKGVKKGKKCYSLKTGKKVKCTGAAKRSFKMVGKGKSHKRCRGTHGKFIKC
jgi:hypothetical protein